MTVSASEQNRASALDEALDGLGGAQPGLGAELFGVVDLLDAQPALRRALTDPGRPAQARTGLVAALLDGKVSERAIALLQAAAQLRWSSGAELSNALERQGVRAELAASGALDEVEDQLFRFGQLVAGDRDLAAAIGNRGVALEARQQLVSGLLQGRAEDTTVLLATRAVAARGHHFGPTLEQYLALAAELRNRVVAKVRVARSLSTEQSARLKAALTSQTGRPVDLQVVVDPEVLGGVEVQLGDEVIEGTVRSRLEDARRRLG